MLAFFLFWRGDYWLGVLSGFVFMVLDTVDGKLARCTGASSKWGNLFDHGIDLVHPPFWWWAWEHGLAAYGRPLTPIYATMVLWAIIGGYVAQRVIEGIFMRRFGGMHIHVWRQIDSRFRLITARRNPNMVILVLALLFGRPDTGLVLVALWTLISLIFHAVRLAQASEQAARGADRLLARVSRWTAFLLAGSRPGRRSPRAIDEIGLKALIPVAGEPMVLRPLRALLASPEVGKIIVLTQDPGELQPIFPTTRGVASAQSRGTIAETLARAARRSCCRIPVLVTTADHALLDAGDGRRVPAKAEGADLADRRGRKPAAAGAFPAHQRTWIGFGAAATAAPICSRSARQKSCRP